jgi:hypothetical protein
MPGANCASSLVLGAFSSGFFAIVPVVVWGKSLEITTLPYVDGTREIVKNVGTPAHTIRLGENFVTMKKLLDPKAVQEHYGIKSGWLAKQRCSGEPGPPFIKIGRKVFYEPSAMEKFIAACRRTSTSDLGSK